jgi:HTH-type transcriptional regulator/antitoxin HigA
MVLPVIKTRALANVEELMSREVVLGSDECARLEALAQAVELYEKEQFPIELPSPSEAVRFRLEQSLEADLERANQHQP